jgi:tRNA(fMet)-specific endonuclease VapC
MILVDTSVFIAVERGAFRLSDVVVPSEGIALAAVTASELLHGVYRAKDANLRAKRESFVERVLAQVPVLPFDMIAARLHARLWAELAATGIAVGAHDLIIAATALANGGSVATRDQRSFPRIPGLTVVGC